MPARVMTLVSVNEEEPLALAHYLDLTRPMYAHAGAQILQRFTIFEVCQHPRRKLTVMLMEYPSIEAAQSLYESADFDLIAPIRKRAFSKHKVAVVSH